MARKDYELIASAIRAARKRVCEMDTEVRPISTEEVLRIVVSKVATALGSDNDRFNRDKFIEECK